MGNFNKVILLGRLTRDPEIRFTSKGLAVTNVTLAVSRKFKGEDSVYKEDTTFVDVNIFGKNAEVVSKFFFKGSLILVEGRLRSDQWSVNGIKKNKLVVVLESFQFTGYSSNNKKPLNNQSTASNELSSPDKQPNTNRNYEDDKVRETEPF
ncbi:MAG: single-stranded DNA-binding protein [Candidatus Organicella extenuata]|uniref:Single-stranded DNA-binding protein n=1 Tax=Candidatus Organicella extenuata TaxID=2841811 RepID=A0AA51BL49_9BACT|nr:MAG: single-stranded DNA-binding protein [Candidatus Organicella extenuata]